MFSTLYNNEAHRSRIYRFKEYFLAEMERILSEQPQRTVGCT